jgi:hypothetical protein
MATLAARVGALAAAVGIFRVVNGVHYPSDIAGDGQSAWASDADAAVVAAAPVSARGRVSGLIPPFLISAVILLSRRRRPRAGGVVADAGFVEGGPFPLLG